MAVRLVAGSALGALLLAVSVSGPTQTGSAAPVSPNNVALMSCNVAGVEAMFLVPDTDQARGLASDAGATAEIGQVWLDLSLSDNHFLPGTFLSLGPLFLGRAVFWNGLLPASLHYYRLNALAGERWVQIGAGTFETPDCDVVTRIACNLSGAGSLALMDMVRFNLGPWHLRGGGLPGPDKNNPVEYLDLVLGNNSFLPGLFSGFPFRAPTVLDVTVFPGCATPIDATRSAPTAVGRRNGAVPSSRFAATTWLTRSFRQICHSWLQRAVRRTMLLLHLAG